MTDLAALADRLEELERTCTPGPWDWSGEPGEIRGWPDPDEHRPIGKFWGSSWWDECELVCQLRNNLPAILSALRAALAAAQEGS